MVGTHTVEAPPRITCMLAVPLRQACMMCRVSRAGRPTRGLLDLCPPLLARLLYLTGLRWRRLRLHFRKVPCLLLSLVYLVLVPLTSVVLSDVVM